MDAFASISATSMLPIGIAAIAVMPAIFVCIHALVYRRLQFGELIGGQYFAKLDLFVVVQLKEVLLNSVQLTVETFDVLDVEIVRLVGVP